MTRPNPPDVEDVLTTVHDAINAAATSASSSERMVPVSVRIPEETKAACQEICERNGTTLSEFLRQCCAGLERDYRGLPREE